MPREAVISRCVKSKGVKGLEDVKRGMKSEDRKLLKIEQESSIQKMILDVMPDQLKLPYALWTRKAVRDLNELPRCKQTGYPAHSE